MTDPKLARDTDNGRYYEDPYDGAMVPSVTNVISEWAKPALPPAAAKVTAEYVVEHLPAAVRASRRPETREAFLKTAKAAYRNAWESKRDLGTLIHDHAEAENLGAPISPDERVEPFMGSYRAWLRDFSVDLLTDIESAEVTVFGRSQPRYGGTADIWAHLVFPRPLSDPDPRFQGRSPRPVATPSGLWVIDIKTSLDKPASAVYRDHVLQLAALRNADVAVLPDGSEVPVPAFAGAAVLNLRPTGYGFVPLPADEAAFLAFQSLIGVARFAHALDLKPYKPAKAPLRAVKNGAA